MIVLVVAADVRGEEPAHEVAELAVLTGPERQVEMVGHQAIGEQTDGHALAGFPDEREEGGVIAVLAEDPLAAIAPVEDVVAIAADGGARGAWHGG
jgi:hypothetical protein